MSHATKPPAKIGTQGTAGMLATARTHSTAGKPVTAGPPAKACSKETAETPTTPMVTPGMSAIAETTMLEKRIKFKLIFTEVLE
jgi:hypothetical protein